MVENCNDVSAVIAWDLLCQQ